MVTTSYPRFPGDGVGSFMEPIAKGLAARGHEIHLVAPWHPAITRGPSEDGVHFHFFRYAPTPAMNIFGYAEALHEDTRLRLAAVAAAPAALAAGTFKAHRVAVKRRAALMHGHWVLPGGLMAAVARGSLPLVVSLHGSDVFVAERHGLAARAARWVFGQAAWVSACSDDLAARAAALGAARDRLETIPYGVDADRFAPSAEARAAVRERLQLGAAPVVFSAGRLVSKKGFEFLIDAGRELTSAFPGLRIVLAGDGDLREALQHRAAAAGVSVLFAGRQSQDEIARLAAAADVVAVPSVHDEAGNVDGLPNFALESLATGTPVVATDVGGLPQVVIDGATGRLVPERSAPALAGAIRDVLSHSAEAARLGSAGRALVLRAYGWPRVAELFEAVYDRVVLGRRHR